MKLLIFLLFFSYLSFSQNYRGVVIDIKSKLPISFANVGIPSKGCGVVCNEKGEFVLKITSKKDRDIVQVFSIGK